MFLLLGEIKELFSYRAHYIIIYCAEFVEIVRRYGGFVGMKELIGKINLIENEQRKRVSLLDGYNKDKIHLKQMAFHKCQKANRWVFGGNRSGKTECGAVECVWLSRGIHPYRKNRKNTFGWVVSLTQQVQRDVAQKKVLSYLSKRDIVDAVMLSGRKDSLDNGVIDQLFVKNAFGGVSVIGFKSCDQGREKFQGASLDFVWFDEEPPEDIYEECKMRLLDKRGIMFGTMTPLKGLTFIYDEIYLNRNESPDVWYEFMEWGDNPYLDPEEVKKMTESLPKDVLDSRRYGRFKAQCGEVYPEFDECRHVVEPFEVPYDWHTTLSIDPGLHNPLSCHFYAVDYDGNVYVVAEHYEAERTISYHARAIEKIADSLGWHRRSDGRIEALIDSAANQKTLASSKSVTELFFEEGIACNPNVNKEKFAGIARVKEYFVADKIRIFPNCKNLIREIKNYRWGDDDSPIKRDDHALDELRYFVMSRPENKRPKKELSAIERDKARLIRKASRMK